MTIWLFDDLQCLGGVDALISAYLVYKIVRSPIVVMLID